MTGTTWRPDVLADFEHTTLAVPFRGSTIDAVVVRRAASPVSGGAAVLYVHGFGDYFFQTHLAAFYEALGVRFYALDLRRHGRALRKGQLPNFTADIDEYLDDVSAAIGLLQAHEGVEWLLLNGHSTGGLVAALYAHRGPRRSDVDAVFLNSPFLDMNLPAWQEAVLEPVLSAVGRIVPSLKLPGLSSLYGESLHADHRGEWSFDLAWKPLAGFPARAGWFRAIHRAQAEVAGGLSIAQPVLLLHAGRTPRSGTPTCCRPTSCSTWPTWSGSRPGWVHEWRWAASTVAFTTSCCRANPLVRAPSNCSPTGSAGHAPEAWLSRSSDGSVLGRHRRMRCHRTRRP